MPLQVINLMLYPRQLQIMQPLLQANSLQIPPLRPHRYQEGITRIRQIVI